MLFAHLGLVERRAKAHRPESCRARAAATALRPDAAQTAKAAAPAAPSPRADAVSHLMKEVGELHHLGDRRVERHPLDVLRHGLNRAMQHAVLLDRRLDVLHGRVELERLRSARSTIIRHTRSRKPRTPLTPSMLQGLVASSGPMNISNSRSASAPYSLDHVVRIDDIAAAFRHLVGPALQPDRADRRPAPGVRPAFASARPPRAPA